MIQLNKSDFEKMLAHARKELPDEACGLIAGEINGTDKIVKKVYLLTNIDHSNEHFSLDPKEQLAAKQVLRDDFEKQLFGEEETKEKAKAKNEEDFLREFEEELLKEDIPEYTESLNQKKQEEKATQIDASLDDLLDNIPQDDFSTGDAAKEEETGFQGKSPLETAIPPDEDDFEVNTLDDAVGTFDSNLPKEEDGELDLSGLSDSDLMDMLSGDQDLSLIHISEPTRPY